MSREPEARRHASPARIAVLTPAIDTGAIDVESALAPLRSTALLIDSFHIAEGPPAINDEADVAACLAGLLSIGVRVAGLGYDAIVVNCMYDPGLTALRAAAAVPVLGPAQTSMHVAAALGARFSIVDVQDNAQSGKAIFENLVASYGVKENYVSHHPIDTPILELFHDPQSTVAALYVATRAALADGANMTIFGCTGLAGLADGVRRRFLDNGLQLRMIEPLQTTIAVAAALVSTSALGAR
jgi:allantoin racemase